jgi:hypothetical protein
MDHCLTYQQVGTRGLRLVVSIDDTFALTVVDKLIRVRVVLFEDHLVVTHYASYR